jgi:acylphosphatase
MGGEQVRKHVLVRGRVQGVFFRDSTRERAQAEGVSGWVANRGDSCVEAVFEGAPDDVDHLVEFCRSGPSSADVEDLEVRDEQPAGLDGFEVR